MRQLFVCLYVYSIHTVYSSIMVRVQLQPQVQSWLKYTCISFVTAVMVTVTMVLNARMFITMQGIHKNDNSYYEKRATVSILYTLNEDDMINMVAVGVIEVALVGVFVIGVREITIVAVAEVPIVGVLMFGFVLLEYFRMGFLWLALLRLEYLWSTWLEYL